MSYKFTSKLKPALACACLLLTFEVYATGKPDTLKINWNSQVSISKTTPTLQLVENPKVRNSSPIHEQVFKVLKDLGADYVRYVPWFPYNGSLYGCYKGAFCCD
jgi:hypothetical protein